MRIARITVALCGAGRQLDRWHRPPAAGLDLSASFTGDIDGETRTVTWDMGADEAVTGTAKLRPKVVSWRETEPQLIP